MTFDEATALLNAKYERSEETYWLKLAEKLSLVPESEYKNCKDTYELRLALEHYSPKKQKSTKSKNAETVYYELSAPIDRVTEKSIGIVVGENMKHGSNRREFIEWVPLSQIVEEEGKIFIPVWIVSKKSLWGFVIRENKIIKSGRGRKAG